LDDDEMARLVAMIKAPNELHPVRNREAYALRLARVRAVLSGRCKPDGWLDTNYAHCGH
jgi:membrane peptidoglycan carboxypeptidase